MDYIDVLNANRGGFSFENCRRNQLLESQGVKFPKVMKTGTTIVGVVCADCVVLAADTRATEGPIVADKEAEKLHYLASNIRCAGAGTSADLEHTTGMVASNLELLRLQTGTQPRVAAVVSMLTHMLFRYQGHIGTALVLGGVDIKGPQLFMIHPHGSSDRLPFACMGSGSLAAMAVFEHGFKDKMTEQEGVNLCADAIRAGIFNDLGSGGNVDVCVVRKDGSTALHLGFDKPNERKFRNPKPIVFPKGTTETLREHVKAIAKQVEVVDGDVLMG